MLAKDSLQEIALQNEKLFLQNELARIEHDWQRELGPHLTPSQQLTGQAITVTVILLALPAVGFLVASLIALLCQELVVAFFCAFISVLSGASVTLCWVLLNRRRRLQQTLRDRFAPQREAILLKLARVG
jgi:hypothetical protein